MNEFDSKDHDINQNHIFFEQKKYLIYFNLLQFVIIGSLISRNHVLQSWMGLDYEQFSIVMFIFSIGAIISNLISSYLLTKFNNKYILIVSFILVSVSLINFYTKPTYVYLCLLFTSISFSFSLNMVILFSQVALFEKETKTNWISFYQSISGTGVVIGVLCGLILNYFEIPINIHYPILGLFIFFNLIFIIKYPPLKNSKDKPKYILYFNSNLIYFGIINFLLIASVSQIINWSGILLKDNYNTTNFIATLGTLFFIIFETTIRFYGDKIIKLIKYKNVLLYSSILTSLSLFLIYFINSIVLLIFLFLLVGLFSGIIQPVIIKLSSKIGESIQYNMSFIFLFQSLGFFFGPIISGQIASNYTIYHIYLFSSIISFFIFLISFTLIDFSKFDYT